MRIWHAYGLQPHRQETWKLSKDPQFIEKVHDICGLYLNPPGARRGAGRRQEEPDPSARSDRADAADAARHLRARHPRLPAQRHHQPHAALNIQSGEVIGQLPQRHRAIEFLKFLKTIDKTVPGHLGVHVVLDNASSHKTPRS